MDNFIDVFGDVTVSRAAVVIAALLFLVGCYRKISKYFGQKAVNDYKQNEQIQEVIDQSKHYPEWRQQSIDVQVKLTDQIETIIEKMEGLEKANGEGMAYTWRYRILRFNDEVRQGIRHTKEHFDQILEDIDSYESFCRENPKFPNNKAVLAIKNIKDVYDKCVEENDFL